jgi:hypothetical protein
MCSTRTSRTRAGLALAALMLLAVAGCMSPPDVGHRLWGYVNEDGQVVIPPQYLDALPFREGLAAVETPQGWGFIDHHGEWVIPPRFIRADSFSGGLAVVRDVNGLDGYIDPAGQWVIAPQFDFASRFIGGRASVKNLDGVYQEIDVEGRVVAREADASPWDPPHKSEQSDFQAHMYAQRGEREFALIAGSGLLPAMSNAPESAGEWGYQDFSGRWVIGPQFDYADPFFDDLARVSIGDKVGFVDRDGEMAVPADFDDALLRFSRDRTVVVYGDRAALVDSAGRIVADLGAWPWPELGEDDFDDLTAYVGFEDFFADGLMPWLHEGRWGYVDLDGHWAIPAQYDQAQFFRGGRAGVQAGAHGLVIDTQGKTLGRTRGRWVAPASDSPARLGTSTAWGFVPGPGRRQADLPFATHRYFFAGRVLPDTRPLSFSEGLALVSRFASHRWTIVDLQGQVRSTAAFDWLEPVTEGRYFFVHEQRVGLADAKLRRRTQPWMDSVPETAWVARDGQGGCLDLRGGRWRPLKAPLAEAGCEGRWMTATPADSPSSRGVIGRDGRWRIPPELDEIESIIAGDPAYFVLKRDVSATKEPPSWVTWVARVTRSDVRYSDAGEIACVEASGELLCLMKGEAGWQRLDPESLQPGGPVFDEIRVAAWPFLLARRNDRWGVLGEGGREILGLDYDGVEPASLSDGSFVFAVRQGARWGLVDDENQPLLPFEYDEIQRFDIYDDPVEQFKVRQGPLWGLVGADGREKLPVRFEALERQVAGLVIAQEAGRRVLLPPGSDQRVDPGPEWLPRITRAAACLNGMWAFTSPAREVFVLDPDTLQATQHAPPEGYDWVPSRGNDNQLYTIDCTLQAAALERTPGVPSQLTALLRRGPDGTPVWQVFDAVEMFEPWPGAIWAIVTQAGKCGVLNQSGEWLVEPRHDHCIHDSINQVFVIADELDN